MPSGNCRHSSLLTAFTILATWVPAAASNAIVRVRSCGRSTNSRLRLPASLMFGNRIKRPSSCRRCSRVNRLIPAPFGVRACPPTRPGLGPIIRDPQAEFNGARHRATADANSRSGNQPCGGRRGVRRTPRRGGPPQAGSAAPRRASGGRPYTTMTDVAPAVGTRQGRCGANACKIVTCPARQVRRIADTPPTHFLLYCRQRPYARLPPPRRGGV